MPLIVPDTLYRRRRSILAISAMLAGFFVPSQRGFAATGKVVPLSPFSKARIEIPADVLIRRSTQRTVRVTADPAVLAGLDIRVEAHQLILSTRVPFQTRDPLRVEIMTTEIQGLEVVAPVALDARDVFGRNLDVKLSAAAEIRLEGLNLDRLKVYSLGTSTVTLVGACLHQVASLDGAGDYDAMRLMTAETTVSIRGSAVARVSVRDALIAEIIGAGSIEYRGQPVVRQSIIGAGTVTRRAD